MKIAIIGLGAMGRSHYAMLKEHTSNPAETVCDINPSQLVELHTRFQTNDPSAAIRLADAVIIATPTHTHAPIALEAIEHGKAIFCQKPLARTLEEAKTILSAVRRKKVPFQVGYIMRFSEVWRDIRQMLAEIGRPIFWREIWHINGQAYPEWLTREEGGGPIFEESHRFDFLSWCLGRSKKAYGYISTFTPKFNDTFTAMIDFEGGKAFWSDSWARTSMGESNREPRVIFDAIGLNGHIVHPVGANRTIRYNPEGEELESISWNSLGISGYDEEMKAFLRYIEGGENEGCTIEEAVQTIALIEAISKSSKEGQVVAVEAIE